jgi:hypothetical protein
LARCASNFALAGGIGGTIFCFTPLAALFVTLNEIYAGPNSVDQAGGGLQLALVRGLTVLTACEFDTGIGGTGISVIAVVTRSKDPAAVIDGVGEDLGTGLKFAEMAPCLTRLTGRPNRSTALASVASAARGAGVVIGAECSLIKSAQVGATFGPRFTLLAGGVDQP